MTLPKDTPSNFCKAFIQRELESYRNDSIWMTYWPVIENMLERIDELKKPFDEMVNKFGYSNYSEGVYPDNSYVWLTLEHIWFSRDFRKEEILQARKDFKELEGLNLDIVELATRLSGKLEKQSDLYETSGFSKSNYLFIDNLIEKAGDKNYLYKRYVSNEFKSLNRQYEDKYWPDIPDLLKAIADFEEEQPAPQHSQYPDDVINGRESDIKDFVIAFDSKFDENNGLPTDFRFSNNALADIINVILELSVEKLATGDAVRNVRNRFKQ